MTLNRAEYGSQQSIQLIGCQNLSSRFAVKICCQDLLSRLVVNIINIVNIVNIFNMVNLTNIMISIPAQGLLNLCQICFKSLSNLCQIFVKHFSFSVSTERFLMQPNFNSAPILSNLCQIFAKSLSNLCRIFVKSKSFSRQCYFLQGFFKTFSTCDSSKKDV